MAEKEKKNNWVLIAIIIIAAALLITKCVPTTDKNKTDEGVSLKVFLSDGNGNKLQELKTAGTMSTITFPSGTPVTGVFNIIIESAITNPPEVSNVPITVDDITGANNPGDPIVYDNALANYVKSFGLAEGQTNTQDSLDIDITQLEYGDILFSMTTDYNYIGAQGQPITDSALGTITLNIVGDECEGGVPDGECNGNGMRCDLVDSIPTLVWNTAVCACNTAEGWMEQGGQCVQPQCRSGTINGQCFTPAYNDPRNFCSWGNEVERCTGADQILGTADDCACPNDYYGHLSTCQTDGHCMFAMYSGTLHVGLS